MSILDNISKVKFFLNLLDTVDNVYTDIYCSIHLPFEEEDGQKYGGKPHPINQKMKELQVLILEELGKIDNEKK